MRKRFKFKSPRKPISRTCILSRNKVKTHTPLRELPSMRESEVEQEVLLNPPQLTYLVK